MDRTTVLSRPGQEPAAADQAVTVVQPGSPTPVPEASSAPAAAGRRTRVLLVDDHEILRDALAARLESTGGFEVVHTAGSLAAALDVLHHQPAVDLILTDHALPDGFGCAVLTEARAVSPQTRVVVLSAHADGALIRRYSRLGVDGYLAKTLPPAELSGLLRRALAGERAFDATATAALTAPVNGVAVIGPLSKREAEVLSLVASGLTNDEIGTRLFLSPQTIKTHLSRIFDKLGARDRAQATATAMREGMIS
jgi:DNA-binding NarL/FixJ family response regulator